MTVVLQTMLEQLSDEDRQLFDGLSHRLSEVKGDISRLSPQDIQLIQTMEEKYGDSIKAAHSAQAAPQAELDLLTLPFAQYVRQVIARDLGAQFPQEEDAIAYVFENKWLPADCQDEKMVADIYERYQGDIAEANQWREELVSHDRDKKMALGLTWFMVVFQLYQRIVLS